MAYFECNLGGGGGGETDVNLIVTCSPNFAGKVITCTDGTDTYTQTCPSTSPYTVTFENIAKGTWTISGVISGQTFTQSVTISDYTAELNDIPDGATVTPVNDVQIWLHCANIWDKNYTTINQVLSDTSTLLALISSNNAADYMARSTNWASSVCANQTAMGYIGNNNYCANALLANSTWLNAICNSTYFESVLNVKVPTMTSATTPSGQVSSDLSDSSPYIAWYAFDGNNSTVWNGNLESGQHWVAYRFTERVVVQKATIQEKSDVAGRLQTYSIQASNNGTTWTTLYNGTKNSQTVEVAVFTNTTAYQYYRLLVKTSNSSTMICKLQFYGRA